MKNLESIDNKEDRSDIRRILSCFTPIQRVGVLAMAMSEHRLTGTGIPTWPSEDTSGGVQEIFMLLCMTSAQYGLDWDRLMQCCQELLRSRAGLRELDLLGARFVPSLARPEDLRELARLQADLRLKQEQAKGAGPGAGQNQT